MTDDQLSEFPYGIPISNPDDATRHTLIDWETANGDAEWKPGQKCRPVHTWTARPGESWSSANAKTYFFRSPQDADLFQRRFA